MVCLVLLIIGIALGAYLGYKDIPAGGYAFLCAIIGGLVALTMFVLPITAVVDLAFPEYQEVQAKELVSLDRGTEVSGHFVLGSGEVEGKPSYFCYAKNDDGGFQLCSLPAENITLFEKPISKGILHIYQPKLPAFNTFSFFTFKDRNRYVLEIPEGSIIREFRP